MSDHKHDSSAIFGKHAWIAADNGIDLLARDRLAVFPDVQPAFVDGFSYLVCGQSAISLSYGVDDGFFNFHVPFLLQMKYYEKRSGHGLMMLFWHKAIGGRSPLTPGRSLDLGLNVGLDVEIATYRASLNVLSLA